MTPGERRKAHLAVMNWVNPSWTKDDAYARLLAHFNEHEPAVADAIRYGMDRVAVLVYDYGDRVSVVDYTDDSNNHLDASESALYVINYPEIPTA